MTGILLAVSFLAGLFVHDAHAGWFGAVVSIGVAAGCCLVRTSRSTVVISAICLVMLGIGYSRASSATQRHHLPELANQHQFSGLVLGVPRLSSDGSSAAVRLDRPMNLVVQARLPAMPDVSQGDVIQFNGDASSPKSESADGDSPAVWASDVTVIGNQAHAWQRLRTAVADRAVASLTSSVPLPAGALAAGVLIGNDSALTSRERGQFRAAGLSHITAVSGWNIALITGLLMMLHSYIPLSLTPRIAVGILGIWGYTYLTGSEPSAVRAAVMGTICLIAIWRGRPRDTLTILLWAIALMLLIQPQTRHSLGFQLSALATLGIVLAMPLLAMCSSWLVLVLVPAIAEISVAPILLHQLGQYSLVSPVTNLLVDPLVVPLTASAGATVVLGTLSGTAGQVVGVIPWLLGKVVMEVAAFSASIPGASGTTPYLSWDGMIALYFMLVSAVFGVKWLLVRSYQLEDALLAFDGEADA